MLQSQVREVVEGLQIAKEAISARAEKQEVESSGLRAEWNSLREELHHAEARFRESEVQQRAESRQLQERVAAIAATADQATEAHALRFAKEVGELRAMLLEAKQQAVAEIS